MKWEDYKAKMLEDDEFREIYEQGEFEFQVKCALIEAQIKKKITKKEIAEKIGTNQANITKFERGSYTPSFRFLQSLLKAIGKEFKFSIA